MSGPLKGGFFLTHTVFQLSLYETSRRRPLGGYSLIGTVRSLCTLLIAQACHALVQLAS